MSKQTITPDVCHRAPDKEQDLVTVSDVDLAASIPFLSFFQRLSSHGKTTDPSLKQMAKNYQATPNGRVIFLTFVC